ncbi:DNA repair protein RAD52 homolog isoform X2 [Cephus cinctus]|uniref:DNA repair protein RAD52 homolog isoform X2 n=1 Tax=Cephus cinctus TaxID=211228 RepID=A0AAJ7RU36_CEPCN|nr:DNA repair protein RAD52 homolog isoform X2 [Cephus cinctus]
MAKDFPSCIKIPQQKDNSSSIGSNDICDIGDALNVNNELIALANTIFGTKEWSHSVTNQTVDFVEYVSGKYHAGCAAYVKVQLSNGIFHEDMGYSNATGLTKGMAIFCARSASITNALKKVLLCFGGEFERRIKDIASDKLETPNLSAIGVPQQFTKATLGPPVHSTPLRAQSPAPSVNIVPPRPQPTFRSISPNLPTLKNDVNPRSKSPSEKFANVKPVQNMDTAMTAEEIMRLERKRKQREKQEEFKRMMKEKETKVAICSYNVHHNISTSKPYCYISSDMHCNNLNADEKMEDKHSAFVCNAALEYFKL